jgi:NAD(P)-dependent dehydrogenase (short-subunit alcohol dehydrogenase family)
VTTGSSYLRPAKGWAAQVGVTGAIPSTARGLAIDLAPLRVNCVSPGLVATEMWSVRWRHARFWGRTTDAGAQGLSEEVRGGMYKATEESSLLKRVATADEIAEGECRARLTNTLNADSHA